MKKANSIITIINNKNFLVTIKMLFNYKTVLLNKIININIMIIMN